MLKPKSTQIPKLASAHYSKAHRNVFDADNRERVAQQLISVLRDFLKEDLESFTCLDIGSSTGIISNYCAKYFKTVIGVDIDHHAVKLARNNFKRSNLKFFIGDGMDLKFTDESFEVVICNEIYSYVDNPDKLMSEIYRILKPNGVCFFTADNLLFPMESQYKLPFLLYLPDKLSSTVLKLLGYNNFYLGHYKTYWGLKNLAKKFIIHDYTLKVLLNPKKYKYIRLYKYKKIFSKFPAVILSFVKFFVPTYVWILQKPRTP